MSQFASAYTVHNAQMGQRRESEKLQTAGDVRFAEPQSSVAHIAVPTNPTNIRALVHDIPTKARMSEKHQNSDFTYSRQNCNLMGETEMNAELQYQLEKLPSGARHESAKLAIALATDELALERANISWLIVDHLADKPTVWGDTLPLPNPNWPERYFIRLALISDDQLVRTIGHELFHVWQFENDVPRHEHEADKFGFELAAEIEWQMSLGVQ